MEEGTLRQVWLKEKRFSTAIGQGYVLTTPLQLAVMTPARSMAGTPIAAPDAKIGGADGKGRTDILSASGISERSRKFLLPALDEAVNHPRGTAFKSRIEIHSRGKTGTAQVRRITMLERDVGMRKSEKYGGSGPFTVCRACAGDEPRCVSVVIEHGGGLEDGAPIAGYPEGTPASANAVTGDNGPRGMIVRDRISERHDAQPPLLAVELEPHCADLYVASSASPCFIRWWRKLFAGAERQMTRFGVEWSSCSPSH